MFRQVFLDLQQEILIKFRKRKEVKLKGVLPADRYPLLGDYGSLFTQE